MCDQQNVKAAAGDNTEQNTIEIKTSDSAGNRTLASGLEGKDSTDHTTTTDNTI